jgi:hypothetical protein
MPVHRISQRTELELLQWAREHYPFWSFTKTFDETIQDLIAEVRRLEDELNK